MNNYSNIIYDYLQKNIDLPDVYVFLHENKYFIGLNSVFSPLVFEDSFWFAETLPFVQGGSFLEVGCGTGLVTIISILKGCTKALASDINPKAVLNMKLNALLYGFEDVIQVYLSNVFDDIKNTDNTEFDTIFWNVPFIFTDKVDLNDLEKSVFNAHYQGIREYIEKANKLVKEDGKVFVGFSSSSGNIQLLTEICNKCNCSLNLYSGHLFADGFQLELYEICY